MYVRAGCSMLLPELGADAGPARDGTVPFLPPTGHSVEFSKTYHMGYNYNKVREHEE